MKNKPSIKKTFKEKIDIERQKSDVLADAVAALANDVMNYIMDVCGHRIGVMFSVSSMVTERLRVIYQQDVIRQMADHDKKDEAQP